MASPKFTLRRVGATASSTAAIVLANQLRPFFVGAPGAAGAAGPQGIAGTAGPAGADGADGPPGPAGETGAGLTILGTLASPANLPQSAQLGNGYVIAGNLYVWDGDSWVDAGSIQGPQGPSGATGATGATGPTGPAGPTGATGLQGQIGLTGPQGVPGTQGPKGDTGATGATGPQGPQGAQGPAGADGADGETSTVPGPQGPAGPTVYPAAGIAVSTGTAWDASKSAPTGDLVGTSDAQTLSNKTLTGYTETVFALSGITPVISAANGTVQTWALTANSAPANDLQSGQNVTLMIDDESSYSITWPSVVWKTGNGLAPTLNTTGFTAVLLWQVGTTLYGARVGNA